MVTMTSRQWLMLGRSMVRALLDSKRTDELLVVEELVCRNRFIALKDELAPQLARDPEARALMADKPCIATRALDYDALRRLPADTLGAHYTRFLDGCGLDPDILAEPAGTASGAGYSDPDAAFLHERYRQTHDIWHALTGLGMEGHEEVILHAFTWGQLRLPYSALIVTLGALKHVVLERRWRVLMQTLPDAYAAGFSAKPLILVYWERRFAEPIEKLRAELGIRVLGEIRPHLARAA